MRVSDGPLKLDKVRREHFSLACGAVNPWNVLSCTGHFSIVVISECCVIGDVTCSGDFRCSFLEFNQIVEDSLVLLFLLQGTCAVDGYMALESMTCEISFALDVFTLKSVPVVVINLWIVPDVVWEVAHAMTRCSNEEILWVISFKNLSTVIYKDETND